MCYLRGWGGVERDYGQAAALLLQAAEEGDAWAMYKLGTADQLLDNDEEQRKWLQRSADLGHREGQHYLGYARQRGYYGFSVDLAQALHWYQQAALQGDTIGGFYASELHDNWSQGGYWRWRADAYYITPRLLLKREDAMAHPHQRLAELFQYGLGPLLDLGKHN